MNRELGGGYIVIEPRYRNPPDKLATTNLYFFCKKQNRHKINYGGNYGGNLLQPLIFVDYKSMR